MRNCVFKKTGIVDGNKRGLTLIELLVSVIICVIIGIALFWMAFQTAHQVGLYVERFGMHTQISNALQDISLRCLSAAEIDPDTSFSNTGPFPEKLNRFRFRGQGSLFNVTPEETSYDVWYEYYLKCGSGVCADGKRGALVLKNEDTNTEDVLIEERYQAYIEFLFNPNAPELMSPNFMKIHLTTKSQRKKLLGVSALVEKIQGVRFWFVDVVKR